jgi:hypothetical protein
MWKIRKVMSLLAIAAFSLGTFNVANAASIPKPPKVFINGEELVIKGQQAVVIKGSVFLPMRAVFDALGVQISLNNTTQKVTATKEDSTLIEFFGHKKIEFKLGETKALLNGKTQVKLTAPAQKVKGTIMVPLRLLAQAFDAQINWDAKANKAQVVTTVFQEFVYTQNIDGSAISYIKKLADIPENPPSGKELAYLLVYQKPGFDAMYYYGLTSIVDSSKNDGSKERLDVTSEGNLGNENMWTGNYVIYSTDPNTEKENYHKSGSITAQAIQATNDKGELVPGEYDYSYFPLTVSQALKDSK